MKHPECKDDEVFYANVNITRDYSSFNSIKFKTKRLGIDAVSSNGCILSQLNPVFIKKEELERLLALKK